MRNLLVLIMAIILMGCGSQTKAVAEQAPEVERVIKGGAPAARPSAIIYKTVKNYNNNVPVTLNADKSTIVSYPAPTDIYYNGNLALPTQLDNGFLLDNRGIGTNVAFTDYTYEQYAAMKEAPSIEELMHHIIDKNPLIAMYSTNFPRDGKSIEVYNKLISSNFAGCTRLY